MSKQSLVLKPGTKVDLNDYDPGDNGGYAKATAKAETQALGKRLAELQEMLFAQSTQSLLIILQGMDASGKDGTIKRVFDSANPQGIRVTSFKAPSAADLAHDFLWRVHAHTPPKGYIGIFNRSHYEDVLVARVNELVPKAVWEKRYDHINYFERLLADSGTRILKFFLHISRDEQKERLQERLDRPDKHWKFDPNDLKSRANWDEYMRAYEDALANCNAKHAPWHVIPANRKWYRDLVITRAIVEALEAMKLSFPGPAVPLDGITIPD